MTPRSLVLTRPRAQAGAWLDALTRRGVQGVNLPLIDLAPVSDLAPVRQAWEGLSAHHLVFFVSPGAVDAFAAARPDAMTAAWPAGLLAAAPGPGTAARLRTLGLAPEHIVQPDAQAARFDSESLWLELERHPWNGRSVLIVRGDGGREWLADRLRAAGAQVAILQAYRRVPPVWSRDERSVFARVVAEPERWSWVFSSAWGLTQLPLLAGDAWPALRQGLQGWATHPRIVQAALGLGLSGVRPERPAGPAAAVLGLVADEPEGRAPVPTIHAPVDAAPDERAGRST